MSWIYYALKSILFLYVQKKTYFIIEIDGGEGQPTLQFAVCHVNLYIVGFRVLPPGVDQNTVPWYSFGKVDLMKSDCFSDVKKSGYDEGYKTMSVPFSTWIYNI